MTLTPLMESGGYQLCYFGRSGTVMNREEANILNLVGIKRIYFPEDLVLIQNAQRNDRICGYVIMNTETVEVRVVASQPNGGWNELPLNGLYKRSELKPSTLDIREISR